MNFSRSAREAEVLDPETIIAVSGDESGLHLEPLAARRDPIDELSPPTLTGMSIGDLSAAPMQAGFARFKIRLASSEGRRSAASYLIRKMYAWRGYETAGADAAPNAITLVASDNDRALGTISIGFDSPAGLLAETLYGDEVRKLRAAGAKVCEFTKLAVDRNEQSRELLAMLFHIAYMYARRLHGYTDLLIEVNPRHVRFYRAMLGFEVMGAERVCPRVNAPAVLLRLSLSYAQAQIARYGGHRELAGTVRSLYPLGFSPEEETGICGRLRSLS